MEPAKERWDPRGEDCKVSVSAEVWKELEGWVVEGEEGIRNKMSPLVLKDVRESRCEALDKELWRFFQFDDLLSACSIALVAVDAPSMSS